MPIPFAVAPGTMASQAARDAHVGNTCRLALARTCKHNVHVSKMLVHKAIKASKARLKSEREASALAPEGHPNFGPA